VRNPKLDEFIDRKKNWIYESPNAVDRDQAIQEIYGVRKYELESWDKKPKTQYEKYFDSKDGKRAGPGKTGARTSSSSESQSNQTEMDRHGQFGDQEESPAAEGAGIIQALNPAPLFNWDTGQDATARFGSPMNRTAITPRGFGDAPFGQKPFGQSTISGSSTGSREMERTWDYRKSPALGGMGDPINDSPDLTRAIMNPISARKASVPAPEASQSRAGNSFGFPSSAPASMRPDSFGFGRDKPMGAPSFTPTPAAPASSPALSTKPAMLEIPRPRF
jgi:hypothetical protein